MSFLSNQMSLCSVDIPHFSLTIQSMLVRRVTGKSKLFQRCLGCRAFLRCLEAVLFTRLFLQQHFCLRSNQNICITYQDTNSSVTQSITHLTVLLLTLFTLLLSVYQLLDNLAFPAHYHAHREQLVECIVSIKWSALCPLMRQSSRPAKSK